MGEDLLTKVVVRAPGAQPKGPYSAGIVCQGRMLFVAGQGPVDPLTQRVMAGSFEEQATTAFDNLASIVEAAGASLAMAVKVQVFLADLADFELLNRVYERYFPVPRPVRTTVQAGLPFGYALEIDAVVALDPIRQETDRGTGIHDLQPRSQTLAERG